MVAGPLVLPFRGITPIVPASCFLAPGSVVVGDVILGENCSVWFNAVVRGDIHYIRIGRQTNIQDGCVLHVTAKLHPVNVGDLVTIGHSAVLHGCTVADACLIGIGARLLDGVTVGESSIVAAGSVVREGTRIPRRSLVVGVPARVKRTLTDEEVKQVEVAAKQYREYLREYLEEGMGNSAVGDQASEGGS